MNEEPSADDRPVTLGQLTQILDDRFAQQDARFEARFEAIDRRFEAMEQRLEAMEQRLLEELGRHVRAIEESFAGRIGAVDDKYNDLPPRVSKLEAATATAPKRARRPATKKRTTRKKPGTRKKPSTRKKR